MAAYRLVGDRALVPAPAAAPAAVAAFAAGLPFPDRPASGLPATTSGGAPEGPLVTPC